MTEKRFTINMEDECIDDAKEEIFIDFNDRIDFYKLCEFLNQLSDENEQLKEALIELKEIGDYQYARIKELSDENEQLEQTNQRLTIALKEIKEKTTIYLEITKGEDQP